MSYNYDVLWGLWKSSKITRGIKETARPDAKSLLFAFLLVGLLSFFGATSAIAQTTLITANDGSFENGATFAANGWTGVNHTLSTWQLGAVSVPATGTNAAYVSGDAGVTNSYNLTTSQTSHFYRDIAVPAGETKISLSFKWKGNGESGWDRLLVYAAPTSVVPVAGTPAANSTTLTGATLLFTQTTFPQASYATVTSFLPASFAGTTFRLIFTWQNDGSGGTTPPATVDDITLTSAVPGLFTSIASGNWSSPATWDANAVPSALDNAIVDLGHTVTVDAASLSIADLTVRGTLTYSSVPTSFAVNKNLAVDASGIVNAFNLTTGKTLTVAGNLVNNGLMDFSIGATTTGNLTLNGSTVQTASGSGTFNTNVIRNLVFSNTNTATPNVNWLFDNIKIANNLTLTTSRVNMSTYKLTFGNNAAAGTLTAAVGTGFLPGAKFSRWWTAAATGSAITAATDPTNATSRYPFINAAGENRAMYITRTNATGAVAGELAVVYNDASGLTSGLSILDGAYTVTDRFNGNWSVSNEGTAISSSSYTLVLLAQNAYYPLNGNSRIISATTALSGAHQNGTTTPGAQRITVSQADLLAGPLYLGVAAADVPFTSVTNGSWNNAATWNKGAVPACTDVVAIATGTNVTVNSAANVASKVTIATGATLTQASGDLTVGCTLNNNTLANSGTLTVTGGTLNVNGNLINNALATFNQSGGDIVVDGNDGVTAESVVTGTYLVRITASAVSNLNLTGGTLTIVDPHYGTSTTDYSLWISQGGAANAASSSHTVKFGNGVSTTAGGQTNGFYAYLFPGSFYYSLGNVTVDALTGTNRFVKTTSNFGITGNLTITSGEYQMASANIIAGNVVNDGILTATGTLALGTFVPPSSILASLNAQSISGSGVFRNLAVAPTASLTTLQVSNLNVAGATLSVPLSVSGTLNLSNGIVNTDATNILTLGTATAAGILAGGSATAYINGPFSRTIASGNANTGFIQYPIGKATYAPIWLAPATTAVSVMKAEAFDTNAGTTDATITNLSAKRWGTNLVSGALTDVNVRLGNAAIVSTNIPVQAPAAAGVYTNAFGSVATFVAGTPNTTQSNNALASANFTGFFSYADSNACSGTPSPGNTVASATTICSGNTVNLSLQNATTGTGVTYAWESSTDGSAYTPISTATNATLAIVPSEGVFYRCQVTCSGSTGTSVAVQISFTNNIATSTPAARCGTGTVNLAATGNSGATINWYDAATTTANLVGTGAAFTTPSINATTTYYAAAESASTGSATLGTGTATNSTTGITPFSSNYEGARIQYLVKASELAAAGLRSGNISSVAFNVTTAGTFTQSGYSVKIAPTADTALASAFATTTAAFTTVYGPVAQGAPSVGLNTITFSTPFLWDGVSNLVIDICHDNDTVAGTCASCYGNNSTVLASTTSFNSVYGRYADNNTLCGTTATGSAITTFTSRPNMIFGGQAVCSSPRVAVTATVTTPPVLTLSSATVVICSGVNSTPVTIATGNSDYDTFAWSPASDVTGNAVSGWIFNPTATTTYVLTASQASGTLCSTTATVVVTANPLPSALTIAPSPVTTCLDTIVPLVASGGTIAAEGIVGTSTSLTAPTAQPTAFCNRWPNYWSQTIYTAAELNAAGLTAGNITSLAYDIASLGDGATNANFTVKIGTTANASFSSTAFAATTDFTTVYGPSTYTHTASGWNTIAFTSPFVWDGVSNIVINVTHDGADATNNSQTYFSLATDKTLWVNSYTGTTTTGALSANRLNIKFSTAVATSVTWSPTTDLYTDANATLAYTAGTAVATVYFKSSTAQVATPYTATSTSGLGCSSSATVAVTVNATAAPTATAQTFCNAATVADLAASGSGTIHWYADATSTTALAATTAVATGTYYVSQTISGCESTRTAVGVTLNVTTAPIVSAQTFCNAATVADLVATGTGTIQWYADAASTIVLASSATLVSGTYYVSQTISACESPKSPVAVVVILSSAPAATAQTFCNAATVADLVATGTGTIQWYADASSVTALASATALATTTYYVSQTISGCESTRTSVAVVVNTSAAPAATAQTFCNVATVADLVATGTGTINWYADATGTTALATTASIATGTYYASQTISGCESTRTSVDVILNVTTAPTATAQTFCNAATVADLTATGTGTIQWYADATSTTALAAGTALSSGSYYVSQMISGCESARTSVVVTLNVTTAPTASAQAFCNAATVTDLVATGTGTIQWFADATTLIALAPSAALATGTYYVSQTTTACESTRTSVAVTVSAIAAPTGAATQTFVTGQTIAAIVYTGTDVIWYSSAIDATNGTNPLASTTLLVNNATYYATQTVSGCTSTTSLAVTVTVTLAVDGFDSSTFAYYPNPVNEVLNITYSQELTSVKVYNMIGQEIVAKIVNATSTQIDMSAYANGAYFIKVATANATKTVKVIKK